MKISPIGRLILEERYLQNVNGQLEEPEQMFLRVAQTVALAEINYGTTKSSQGYIEELFYQMLSQLDFLPNSPTLLNSGKINGQLAACFVLPIKDQVENIFETLQQAAIIHSYGGGTGFSFSNITPANWQNTDRRMVSPGPVAYIQLFHQATELIRQGGIRPGANMATIAVNHPDIFEFLGCKRNKLALNSFNLSVAVTDAFMEKVVNNDFLNLEFEGKLHKKVLARDLWEELGYNAWATGEPGIIFVDHINRTNPLPGLGMLETTNPCGEQPLLPYEACNLGSINIVNMLENNQINWNKLQKTIELAIRFLDNVIDINWLPINEIKQNVAKNRKIGLGIMGFATLLQLLRIPYNSESAIILAEKIMNFVQQKAHKSSMLLAHERGSFPNIKHSIYQNQLRRNATCTTIAPTGTISTIAGVSPGIEPFFALIFERKILGRKICEVNSILLSKLKKRLAPHLMDDMVKHLLNHGNIGGLDFLDESDKEVFITAPQISPKWHVKIQAAFQKYCDNAVSKTVNLPNSATVADVLQIFRLAYQLNCKGVTVYRIGSRQDEALTSGSCLITEGLTEKIFC